MTFEQIQELIKLLDSTGIAEFKLDHADLKLRIRSRAYAEAIQKSKVAAVQTLPITATPQLPIVPPPPIAAEAPIAPSTKTNAPTPPATADNLITIKAPMIGTFYRAPGPNKPNFVQVGDTISSGTVLCIIEAMKLFNEIESEVSGTIVKVLADDGKSVEYDQPLFLVQPA